jgi:hypothetical protein
MSAGFVAAGERVAGADSLMELRSATSRKAGIVAGAQRLVHELGFAVGMHPDSLLEHRRTSRHEGADFVRLQQRVGGLPVLGGQVVVRMEGGVATLLSSGLVDGSVGCDDLGAAPASLVTESTARDAVERALAGGVVDRAELMQVPHQGCLVPRWVVQARTFRPYGSWRYLVDAVTGEVVFRHSLLDHATGRVYAVSPAVPANAGTTDVTLTNLTSATQLVGQFVDVRKGVVGANNQLTVSRLATADNGGNFLYTPTDPSLADAFSEVQMYHHVNLIHQHLATTHGFARPRASQSIKAFTNYTEGGQGVANAFFGDVDGDAIGDLAFGQASVDFAYDATVIYHEFGHSVVQDLGGLNGPAADAHGVYEEPGALNEAFSDYFAASFTGNPLIGQYAARAFGLEVVRRLDVAKSCPESFVGQLHQDSLVWSSTLWEVRQALGQSTADRVVYDTLDLLAPDASMATAAQLLLNQANAIGGATARQLVEPILQSHGLIGCERYVPLRVDDGTGAGDRRGFVYGQNDFGLAASVRVPAGIQYKLDTAPNATQVQLQLSVPGGSLGPNAPVYRLIVRKDAPVGVTFIPQGGGSRFEYVADYIDTTAAGNAPVTMTTQGGSLRLAPGASYYILVASTSRDAGTYSLRATSTFDAAAALQSTDATGTTGAGNGSAVGGCSTTHGARPTATGWLLALVALLGAMLRSATAARSRSAIQPQATTNRIPLAARTPRP